MSLTAAARQAPGAAGPQGPGRARAMCATGAVTAVAALALVAGCAGPPASPAPPAGVSRIFATAPRQVQELTIGTAQQELEQRCMTKAGFQFRISSQATQPSSAKSGDTNPLLVDTSQLAENGYGLYQIVTSALPQGRRAGSADPNVKELKSLSPEQRARWNTALQGATQETVTLPDGSRLSFPGQGCYAQSLNQLYGSVARYYALQDYASNLVARIGIQAGWSTAWQHAQAQWRHCMAAHGYPYTNETAAQIEIYDRYQAPHANLGSVHSYELRVAGQDAACANQSGIAAAAHIAVRQAAATFTAEQVGAVLTWNQMQARALAFAEDVLGTH